MACAGALMTQPCVLCLPPATGDLPEQGGVIVSSPATPFRKPIEHAGHCYQQQLIRTYAVHCESDSKDEPATQTNKAAEKDEPVLRAQSHQAAKNLASKMAVGSDDLYELLELGDKRWHATADDIKKSFRRISLIYHPDKISHHGDEARKNAETHFKAVMKAYDILSDKKKRAAYDSIDDVDDSIPTEKDATSSSARFYEKFGACFAINARWSVSDRVPQLGDDDTDLETVDRFYDFWYSFKSWRDFSFDLEYNTDQAESREEKRWMDRQNAKHIKTKKLEENARIRKLVDLAYKHDPRLKRAKQAEKAKKDAEKQERRRKAEEASRKAKEKEQEEQLEAEKRAAEEKAKRAAAKKQKDAARQVVRKARQKLRAISRELALTESEKGLVTVERMCAEGNAESIEAVTAALAALPKDTEDTINRAQAILDKALTAPDKSISTLDANCNTAMPADESDEKLGSQSMATPAPTQEQLPNGHSSPGIQTNPSTGKSSDTPWTPDELSLLSKGLAKFPGGTRDRWQRLSEYISTRTADEVLRKVNENRNSKMKSGTKKQATDDTESNAFVRFQEKKKGKPVVPQKSASKPNGKATPPPAQPPNKLFFTPKQQALFEEALKKYPKGDESRWKKVSAAVGRTPQHCQQRFDELIAYYAAKRAAK